MATQKSLAEAVTKVVAERVNENETHVSFN